MAAKPGSKEEIIEAAGDMPSDPEDPHSWERDAGAGAYAGAFSVSASWTCRFCDTEVQLSASSGIRAAKAAYPALLRALARAARSEGEKLFPRCSMQRLARDVMES